MRPVRWRALSTLIVFIGLLLPALATVPVAPPAAPASATPAFWRVTGKLGTIYLFGSVHILPPSLAWRSAALDKAIKSASVFAFEIPEDQGTIQKAQELVATRGMLPPGGSLRAMLSADAQKNLDAVAQMAGAAPAQIDGFRPWLADLVLSVAVFRKQSGATGQGGADHILSEEARAGGKELRYLETAEQQLDLVAPDDPKVELSVFEYDLKEMRDQPALVPEMVDAWSRGDTKALDTTFNAAMKDHPEARKAMIDDRNAAWVAKMRPWLDGENKVFFVTVGAGHLVGDRGVPMLLKHAGYTVEGPLH